MNAPLELSKISERLAKVDTMLMALLRKRMELALEVERRKAFEIKKKNRKIFQPVRENKRIRAVKNWAGENGMNPHFAEAVLYLAIGESCKQQMIQLQNRVESKKTHLDDEKKWSRALKRNLLTLTKQWSKSYNNYGEAFFGTRTYLGYELGILEQEISKLPDREVFVDLGCATGRLTFQLARRFKRVVGYDISPHMIEKANAKIPEADLKRICFKVVDIESGIPEPDNSVSLIVMNLGTASDVREIKSVLKEIARVLKPHGRFFLSFYNSEALLYRWDFIPWPTGLAAQINIHKHCLDVHSGKKILSVYARPYSSDEISDIIKGGITISQTLTYPTISAILPNDLFENQPEVQKSIEAVDKELATSSGGAYIIATGQKVG